MKFFPKGEDGVTLQLRGLRGAALCHRLDHFSGSLGVFKCVEIPLYGMSKLEVVVEVSGPLLAGQRGQDRGVAVPRHQLVGGEIKGNLANAFLIVIPLVFVGALSEDDSVATYRTRTNGSRSRS